MQRTYSSICVGLLSLSTLTALAQPALSPVTPAAQAVSLGARVQFNVTVESGTPPYGYQWYHGGAPIDTNLNPSAAKSLLSLTNVTLGDAGDYTVVVTDTTGPTTSSVATLSVCDEFKTILTSFLPWLSDGPWPYWVDLDGDGWQDVVRIRGFWSDTALPLDFFKNNRDGTFTQKSNGLTSMPGHWNGILCADFDGNGMIDVLGYQCQPLDPVLFLNQGDGVFTRVSLNITRVVNHFTIRGQMCAAGDYDRDGLPDLFVSYWRDWGGAGYGWNRQVRNLGRGWFEVVTNSPFEMFGASVDSIYLLDYDDDGDLDVYAPTSLGQPDLLLQQQPDGTFLSLASHPLVDFPTDTPGATWGDYNNDCKIDAYVPVGGNLDLVNTLYRGLGGGQFEVDTNSPALTTGFCRWADYDNDGDLDLFMTPIDMPSLIFRNNGDGTFTQASSPGNVVIAGFWADFNNDGFLDLLGQAFNNPHQLLQNNLPQLGNTNHWLKVQFRGTVSSTEGIGVKVFASATIRGKPVRQLRLIIGDGTEPNLVAHFGLGDAAVVDTLRIEWPSGLVQELTNVSANQFLTITEHEEGNPPAPTLTASPSADGAVKLTLSGQPHCGYVIQGSEDLVKWVKVRGCHTLSGTVEHTDLKVAGQTARFYRVLVP